MSETNYRIRYKKGDLEVEVQGDKDWVEKKFKELVGDVGAAVIDKKRERETPGLPKTLVEFLDLKGNPKKHRDVTAVFAYWLYKVEGMESFNAKDIEDCYDQTRKNKPRNINDVSDGNIKRRFFAEAKERKDGLKAWLITRPGIEYVEQMK